MVDEVKDEELTRILEDVQGADGVHQPVVLAPEMAQKDSSRPVELISDSENQNPFIELISKFNSTAQEALDNFKTDRREIESALEVVWGDLKKAIINGEKRPEALFSSYIELIKTKTNNNANVTKLLDSIARLLQAGRSSEAFTGGSSGSLTEEQMNDLLQ